jgi:hypothetical protein
MSASGRNCAAAQRDFRDRRRFQAGAVDDPGFQHHHLHRRRGAVLYRHRPVRGFAVTLGDRHHHHGFHRVYPDPPDRGGVGALEAAADGADLGNAALTHFVLIALGVLIAVLTVVSALGLFPRCGSSRTIPTSILPASGASVFRSRQRSRLSQSRCSLPTG